MNPHSRFANVVERLNALTSRTANQSREIRRRELHSDPAVAAARIEPITARLEQVCDELEKALA